MVLQLLKLSETSIDSSSTTKSALLIIAVGRDSLHGCKELGRSRVGALLRLRILTTDKSSFRNDVSRLEIPLLLGIVQRIVPELTEDSRVRTIDHSCYIRLHQ